MNRYYNKNLREYTQELRTETVIWMIIPKAMRDNVGLINFESRNKELIQLFLTKESRKQIRKLKV